MRIEVVVAFAELFAVSVHKLIVRDSQPSNNLPTRLERFGITIVTSMFNDMKAILTEEELEYFNTLINKELFPYACPYEGEFYAYKACAMISSHPAIGKPYKLCMVKLLIPEDAKRLSSFGSTKCRCDKADVVDIYNPLTGKHLKKAKAIRNENFIYEVGQTVRCTEPFDDNRLAECSSGIHFCMTEEEVMNIFHTHWKI